MIWSEVVMRHMVICCNFIYISLWPVWIWFRFCLKKGFWIDTNRKNYPTSSQSIRYGRSTLFFCELERQRIFSYEWICKTKWSCSIIGSDPILCDYRPTYGYHCCCSILTMSHPTNEIYGGFGQYCYACFVLMYIVTNFSYVITT